MINKIKSLCANTKYITTDLANISSYLFHELKKANWVGFYIVKDNNLHLGPFNGKVACTYISYGKGVCGSSLERKEAIYVSDVNKFDGHIVCDMSSRSEFVIPIFLDNEIAMVLDIDKSVVNGFDLQEREELLKIGEFISSLLKKPSII